MLEGGRLAQMVRDVLEVRTELRAQGASPIELAAATERVVRDAWEPLCVPERQWPVTALLAKCAYCDGTGLVIRHNVKNKLNVIVDEGTPCRCSRGARFEPKQQTQTVG
jgi:hypothetical protein